MLERIAIVLSMISFIASAGCGGGLAQTPGSGTIGQVKGDRTLVSHSEGVKPMWVQECPVHSKHILAFCGESHGQASYNMAYSAAYADALGKLKRFIGQKVEARLEPDGQGGYRFQIQGVDDEAVSIRGVWEGERWAEVWQGPSGQTNDCHVMLTYQRLEYDRLVGKANAINEQKLQKAQQLHAQGKEFAQSGRAAEATTLFQRAKALLTGLTESLVLPDGTNSKLILEQIEADLQQSAQAAAEANNTALVVVGYQLDGQLQSDSQTRTILNKIQKWVVEGGAKIRPGGLPQEQVRSILIGDQQAAAKAAAAKGAGILLVLDLQCEFKTQEEGVFYSYASGGMRFIRTDDGRELYTASFRPTKGALFTKQAANQKAVDNLLKEQVKQAVKTAMTRIR